ncbi:MAG: squalene synthase HpnC, partial [Ignavibacteriales bacterium]
DGKYDGYPELGAAYLETTNPALRRDLGMPPNKTGIAVYYLDPNGSAIGYLKTKDVLLSVDGYQIESDATVTLNGNSVLFAELLERKQCGDSVLFKVWRDNAEIAVKVPLKGGEDPFAYRNIYDKLPEYFIFAGLVFSPLNRECLRSTARQADNIADEGSFSQKERIEQLDEYKKDLSESLKGNFRTPFWQTINNTIVELKLSPSLFYDLLVAFKQDVLKKRYKDFLEILDYCKYSANPVGRLILELHNIRDEESKKLSDSICTALQLANFYQDLSLDFLKGRIYIPVDEMESFGITENDFEKKKINSNFSLLIKQQVQRAKVLFQNGYSLIDRLPFKLAIEIKWTILGGEEILNKIEKNDYNVLTLRPVLTKKDFAGLFIKSFKKLNGR